jgi:hypothetical protein
VGTRGRIHRDGQYGYSEDSCTGSCSDVEAAELTNPRPKASGRGTGRRVTRYHAK